MPIDFDISATSGKLVLAIPQNSYDAAEYNEEEFDSYPALGPRSATSSTSTAAIGDKLSAQDDDEFKQDDKDDIEKVTDRLYASRVLHRACN